MCRSVSDVAHIGTGFAEKYTAENYNWRFVCLVAQLEVFSTPNGFL